MSKIDSPSSNNSRTSSETSETQSVDDNIPVGGNDSRISPQTSNSLVDRNVRKLKRMKDANNDKDSEKRPPWRAVSLSTLPKPDKNALLKAKLLDASRRMRAGKVSASVQTDIVPTKLMKEVNLGVQVDLILLREAGMMTDGSYMKRKQGTDEFVLTYSVSTVTDGVKFANVSTQTLLPKLPEDELMNANLQCNIGVMDSQKFNEAQQKLLQQIQIVREATSSNSFGNANWKNLTLDDEINQDQFSYNFSKPSLLKQPTLQSWHFELDEIGTETFGFKPYTISSNRPWNSFMPLYYDGGCMGSQRLDWNILFLAIDELIRESNSLVDMIEDLSKQKIKVVEVPKFESCPQHLPSDYWLPIIEEQEKKLKSMKENMKITLAE